MRITKIELAGSKKHDWDALPRAFATIERKEDARNITVTIMLPGGERDHLVDPSSDEDLHSMAACLDAQLEGNAGLSREYHAVLCRFAD